MDRLERQFAFILEADKEKSVMRQTLLSNSVTHENDADHAWHMALMCLLLSEYANEKIDVLRTVGMILIHDIVEIAISYQVTLAAHRTIWPNLPLKQKN